MTPITDHAIVRYLERVKGVDMDAIRAEMQSASLAAAVEFGAKVLIGRHGERLVIRDGIVVTVIAKARNAGRTMVR